MAGRSFAGETATLHLTGAVTVAVMAQAFELLAAHPRYREGMARLWDLRKAHLHGLSSVDLDRIRHYAAAKLSTRGARVAVVVASDVDFGIVRMFQSWEGASLPASMEGFRDVESAEAWLKAGDRN